MAKRINKKFFSKKEVLEAVVRNAVQNMKDTDLIDIKPRSYDCMWVSGVKRKGNSVLFTLYVEDDLSDDGVKYVDERKFKLTVTEL